ncbi:MAG: sigma-70 family polymerase sigma factor [Clostridia bacterium]|jgi:RNA polymerase sigma-70 factor (ECF subfamily)|nr:sigma-70 family polymerase sigma factor [Clostridia bacterium]
MHENTELQLINQAKAGNIDAFETLIKSYEKSIYTICLRMLLSEEEAYDATQEVCVKIWRQLHIFKGDSKLSTWIYRITTNQCLDLLRKNKNKNKKEISLFQKNDDDEEWMIDQGNEKENVEKIMENKELKEILKEAIYQLKEDYKTVIVLRDINQYSYDEIAQILNISLGTVKSRLSRARASLRYFLEQTKEPYRSFFVKMSNKEGTQ